MAETPEELKRRIELLNQASESLLSYNKFLAETAEIEKNIVHIKKTHNSIANDIKITQNKLTTATGATKAKLEDNLKNLQYMLKLEEGLLQAAENEVEVRRQILKEVDLTNASLKTMLATGQYIGRQVLQQTGYFLKQQKAVKETELSMGILSNQSQGFRTNVYKTAITTTKLGVNTQELAKMQGTYADNVGRAIQLSESQLTAIAEIKAGTMLSAEAAAEFAANFESIGISAEGTADYVQEALNDANAMGNAASKVIKNIQKNFKLINKYNFQNGVKGLSDMAQLATRFKFEMQSIASFADTIMTPEGAVEVASKLQVLGGEWAKLGDPFELMYKSRNDIEGLTQDIINATKATARFDKATGEFTIDPMEMSRLREVANLTGMQVEELAQMTKQSAKFDRIGTFIPNIFNKEDKKYLESLATFDKKTKQFKITMQTKEGKTLEKSITDLGEITPEMVKYQREYVESLEDRAKRSMTFNERFQRLVESFQSSLLPAFEVVATQLEKWIESLTPIVERFANFFAKYPEIVATIGTVLGGLALLGDKAMWFLNGKFLRMGFNSGGPLGGGGGGTTPGGGMGPGGMRKGTMAKGRKILKARKLGRGMGPAAGVLAGVLSGIDEYTENSEAGMDQGENFKRTGVRGLLSGGGAWGGAAAGAALGTAILPIVGTAIGGIIGGIAGGYGGDLLGDKAGDLMFGEPTRSTAPSENLPSNNTFQDFIARPGENAISFSSNDTLIGAKKDGPIDKMIERGKGETAGGKVSVEFKDAMRIEGSIDVKSGGQSAKIDLEDPILMRDLSKIIMQELSRAIGGGKISSNPVSVA